MVWKKKKSPLKRYDVKALNYTAKCESFDIELKNRFLPLADSTLDDIDS